MAPIKCDLSFKRAQPKCSCIVGPRVALSNARTQEHKHCDLGSDIPVWGLEHLPLCHTCSLDAPALWGFWRRQTLSCASEGPYSFSSDYQKNIIMPPIHQCSTPQRPSLASSRPFSIRCLTPRILLHLVQWSRSQRRASHLIRTNDHPQHPSSYAHSAECNDHEAESATETDSWPPSVCALNTLSQHSWVTQHTAEQIALK